MHSRFKCDQSAISSTFSKFKFKKSTTYFNYKIVKACKKNENARKLVIRHKSEQNLEYEANFKNK